MGTQVGWCRLLAFTSSLGARPAYRATWATVAFGLGALGAVAAATLQSVSTTAVTAGVVVVLCGWTCAMGALALDFPVRRSLGAAMVVAVGVVMVSGLSLVVSGWSLLLVGLLAVTAPRVLRLMPDPAARAREGEDAGTSTLRSLAASQAWRHAEPGDAAGEPASREDVAHLSTRALCVWWQTTTAELARDHDAARIRQLVDLREAVLDELAARDPEGLARWLRARGVEPDPIVWFGPGGATS
jgi:hypothetical protein